MALIDSWGFIRDLRECEGKTIEKVEVTDLGFGYTISHCWTVLFTDGTRAFFGERPSKGTVCMPSQKAMEQSNIFKPEELADLVADRMRKEQESRKRHEDQERRELEKLQRKYGAKQHMEN